MYYTQCINHLNFLLTKNINYVICSNNILGNIMLYYISIFPKWEVHNE